MIEFPCSYYFLPVNPACSTTTTTSSSSTTTSTSSTTTTLEPTTTTTTTTTTYIEQVGYGLLYNWYAATDARNISADGWRLPYDTDWVDLHYSTESGLEGNYLKEIGSEYWDNLEGCDGINALGFNLRGAGYRDDFYNYNFDYIRKGCLCWVSRETPYLIIAGVWHSSSALTFVNYPEPKEAISIRLCRNANSDELLLIDGSSCDYYISNDGKNYRTVKIGTLIWLADNLAETKYRNGDTIPEVTDNTEWSNLTTGALCAYNNDWNNV